MYVSCKTMKEEYITDVRELQLMSILFADVGDLLGREGFS